MKYSITAVCLASVLAGCATSQSYPMRVQGDSVAPVVPTNNTMQQQQPYVPEQAYNPQNMQMLHAQVMAEVNSLRERLQRVERAMIRLDRRMQLVETNALGRMTGEADVMSQSTTPQDPDLNSMFRPMAYVPQNMGAAAVPYAQPQAAMNPNPTIQQLYAQKNYGVGMQQVAYHQQQVEEPQITSALQAGTTKAAFQKGEEPAAKVERASFNGLPSLADESAGQDSNSDASVSIWTIDYEKHKIWPDRSQLTGSRDVVEALRDEKPVALFARGANPASREFRERVRAISRYLGRVAGKESIPIASLPAEHLDGDTIEILATK